MSANPQGYPGIPSTRMWYESNIHYPQFAIMVYDPMSRTCRSLVNPYTITTNGTLGSKCDAVLLVSAFAVWVSGGRKEKLPVRHYRDLEYANTTHRPEKIPYQRILRRELCYGKSGMHMHCASLLNIVADFPRPLYQDIVPFPLVR